MGITDSYRIGFFMNLSNTVLYNVDWISLNSDIKYPLNCLGCKQMTVNMYRTMSLMSHLIVLIKQFLYIATFVML